MAVWLANARRLSFTNSEGDRVTTVTQTRLRLHDRERVSVTKGGVAGAMSMVAGSWRC